MNTKLVEDIASAVLYEGYLLYPYRASAIKNQQRWNFGVLYPREYAEKQSGADAWKMQTECLVTADSAAKLEVRVRFLQLDRAREADREACANSTLPAGRAVPNSRLHPVASSTLPKRRVELDSHSKLAERSVQNPRHHLQHQRHRGVHNETTLLLHSLVSTHTIFNIQGGEFISLLDPPDQLRDSPRRARTWALGRCWWVNLASATPCFLRPSSSTITRRSRRKAREHCSMEPRSTRS